MKTLARVGVLVFCLQAIALGAVTPPKDPGVHFERGRALLESRRADQAALAMAELQRARQGFEAMGGRAAELAETFYALGLAAEFSEDRTSALDFNQRAIDLFEQLDDDLGVAAARDHRAYLLIHQGRLDPARSQFRRALEARQRTGDRSSIARSLHNLGSLELEAGRGGEALELLQQSLELQKGHGDPRSRAALLNNLGLLRLHMGRADSGQKLMTAALEEHRRAKDHLSQAGTLNNLAWVAWQDRRWTEARKRLNQALDIYRSFGNPRGLVETLGNLALVDLEEGNLDRSRRRLEKALAEARDHGFARIGASHLASWGRWQLVSGAVDRAIATLRDAAERQRALEDPESLSITLFDLAKAQQQKGEPVSALATLDESIAAVEAMGSRIGMGDLRAYFLAPRRRLYDFRIQLLIQQGRWADALLTSEQARARGLLDLLAWDAPTSEPAHQVPPSLEQIRALIGEGSAALVFHLGEPKAWAWVITRDGLDGFELGPSVGIEDLASTARESLAGSHRRLARGLAQRSLDALARSLAAPLSKMTQRRWLVVPDGGLHGVPFAALPLADGRPVVSRHEVVTLPSLTLLSRLRDRHQERQDRQQKSSTPDPQPRGELAVLADPVFHPGDPRLGSHAEPTITERDPKRDRSHSERIFDPTDLDLPRLPFSAEEAKRITESFSSQEVRVHTGFDATAEIVTGGSLNHFRRLHFATHAIVDDQYPERSGLALSAVDPQGRPLKRGFLGLPELFRLRLDADLVTLSACRSALGKPLRGEGLLGLSRGFFSAGARRLVAGLWDVDDRAAVELMATFYRLSIEEGLDSAAALAEAQRRLSRDPRWSAPFYWASFVLLGDWI